MQRFESGSLGLLSLLYERRGRNEAFLARLKGVHRHIWYGNHTGFEALRAALEPLRRRGLPALVLRDAALIERYYRRLGVRPLVEPAVLVRTGEPARRDGGACRGGLAPGRPGGPISALRARTARRGSRCASCTGGSPPSWSPVGGPRADSFWAAARDAEAQYLDMSALMPDRRAVDHLRRRSTDPRQARLPVDRRWGDHSRDVGRGDRLGSAARGSAGAALCATASRCPCLPLGCTRCAGTCGGAETPGCDCRTIAESDSHIGSAAVAGGCWATYLRRSRRMSSPPRTRASCELRHRSRDFFAPSGDSTILASCPRPRLGEALRRSRPRELGVMLPPEASTLEISGVLGRASALRATLERADVGRRSDGRDAPS